VVSRWAQALTRRFRIGARFRSLVRDDEHWIDFKQPRNHNRLASRPHGSRRAALPRPHHEGLTSYHVSRPHPEERLASRVSKDALQQDADTPPHSRGAICPSHAPIVSPKKNEGVGNAGCPVAPAASRGKK
jgi:hypothetical protein